MICEECGFISAGKEIPLRRGGRATAISRKRRQALFVRDRAKNGDGEMREKGRAFVELQPAHHAMILQIFPDARFVDAQMVGELFLQVGAFAAAAPAAKQIADTDAQCLAGFDIVVAVWSVSVIRKTPGPAGASSA